MLDVQGIECSGFESSSTKLERLAWTTNGKWNADSNGLQSRISITSPDLKINPGVPLLSDDPMAKLKVTSYREWSSLNAFFYGLKENEMSRRGHGRTEVQLRVFSTQ